MRPLQVTYIYIDVTQVSKTSKDECISCNTGKATILSNQNDKGYPPVETGGSAVAEGNNRIIGSKKKWKDR